MAKYWKKIILPSGPTGTGLLFIPTFGHTARLTRQTQVWQFVRQCTWMPVEDGSERCRQGQPVRRGEPSSRGLGTSAPWASWIREDLKWSLYWKELFVLLEIEPWDKKFVWDSISHRSWKGRGLWSGVDAIKGFFGGNLENLDFPFSWNHKNRPF